MHRYPDASCLGETANDNRRTVGSDFLRWLCAGDASWAGSGKSLAMTRERKLQIGMILALGIIVGIFASPIIKAIGEALAN